MTTLERLQRWYESQCDGDWEHEWGIKVDTLDNPGWSIRVDLADTGLDVRTFEPLEIHRSENDWIVARLEVGDIEDVRWCAYCGPLNLEEAIGQFLEWSESAA